MPAPAPARTLPLPALPLVAHGWGRRQARASLAGAKFATECINKELAQQALKPLDTSFLKHL
eukprot:3239507-Heterocapsa_arctica.AAC.1